MKIGQKFSLFLLTLVAALGVGAWQAKSWWTAQSAPMAAAPTAKVLVQIPSGTSTPEIGQKLVSAGVIRSAKAWQVWAKWLSLQNQPGGFQAGSYELSPGDGLPAIAQKIWTGEVVTRSFTIPEGWNIRQMAAYFEQEGFFPAQAFVTATTQVPTYAWLPPTTPHLEGYLYPDTYQLVVGEAVTPQQVIKLMLDRFGQIAIPVYQKQQAKTGLSLAQWVTLASIVEKEAVVPQERSRIAGVFTNRLRQGISLGSDPTVEYGLGVQQTKEQPLTLAQVRQPSPYNTYINAGLPPTPIASPGIASLQATLAPEATDYLYFVAKYDGTHVFSRTLAEHETAQTQIRDKVDAQAAQTPPPATSPSPPNEPAKPTNEPAKSTAR
jgi:UPF0755 protein